MNNSSLADHATSSDDEIFFGPLTLKEIKKRLIPEYRQTIRHRVNTDPKDDTNSSLKVIKTYSARDVSSKGDLRSLNITYKIPESSPNLSPDVTVSEWSDDSFLRLEQMVSDECMSTDKPHDESKSATIDNNEIKVTYDSIINQVPGGSRTSMTEDEHNFAFKTPSSELKITTPLNKIPGNPISQQLPTLRRHQNVASPVAVYIRNSPQVPLMKHVCPKRPLPGVSAIPKPLRQIPKPNVGNKENFKQENVKVKKLHKQENIKLPALAYRSAKETKVIDIPNVENMPQNQRAKKVVSSIPKAMVVKHTNRETSSAKNPLQGRPEDSSVGLPLHQAVLSVRTQKSSYAKPKKNI